MDKKQPTPESNIPHPPARLGDLLVKQGYLKKEDIDKAIVIQNREKKWQHLPIGQILVEMGVLSPTDVDRILNHPELREKIGKLAVERGYLSEEQLIMCLKEKEPDHLIGQAFLEKGFISSKDLEGLLKEQIKSPRFGELAVKLNLISEEEVKKALRIQTSPRRLGEILCDLGIIDPLDLNQCLANSHKQLDLGETLIHLGYIAEEELQKAKTECKYGTESFTEVLLRKKYVTEEELQSAISRHYNIPFEPLRNFVYTAEIKQVLSKIISRKYAETKLIIPISFEDNRLMIGIFRPQERLKVIYDLKEMYRQYTISCILITKEKFEELFEILYSTHLIGSAPEDTAFLSPEIDMDFMALNIDEEIGDEDIKKTTVYGKRDIEAEELVNFILSYGIVNGASDIHIEQSLNGVKLRYRFDGLLREAGIGWLNKKLQDKAPAIISRIKILANLDIAEKRIPQDGSFRTEYVDKTKKEKIDLDFRVAICRAAVGENVTIRILDPRRANVGLHNLNHSPHVFDPFKRFLKSPSGMILVCGPTGCGKTSTLYAALQYIDNPNIKIITAEDPIEYHFPSVMQTQVNPKINMTFSRLLRSFLRFDPDVMLVGEMRDEETAKIGFDAVQTGHLILSTLHTNDSLSAIPRLVDLKVEYGQIASSLMCVVAQRLVRKICPSCVEEYMPGEEEWGILFKSYPSHLRFYRGHGCKICNNSGYDGRTLLSEIFAITPEISQALNRGYDESQISRLALESGMKSMLDDGLMKLNQTTLSEIIRMLPHDMIKKSRLRQKSQGDIDGLIENMMGSGQSAWDETEKISHLASFEITNPETERSVMDLILAKYEAILKDQNGDGSPPIDTKSFKAFIEESFYKIYEQQPCKSMTFNIGKSTKTGKIKLSVVPNL